MKDSIGTYRKEKLIDAKSSGLHSCFARKREDFVDQLKNGVDERACKSYVKLVQKPSGYCHSLGVKQVSRAASSQ